MAGSPECAVPACRRAATDAHHVSNRGMGWRDHDPRNGMPLSRDCHRLIDEIGKREWARRLWGFQDYHELARWWKERRDER